MKAQALICSREQQFSLSEVELPEPGPHDLVIRAHYTGVSIGTEFALIRGKLSWGPYPLCTGYQGVGVVEWAGAETSGFKPGDLVYYRNGRGPLWWQGTPVTCASGTHCSRVVTDTRHPTHGPALLPEGVDPELASTFVMPAVGFTAVDMAGVRMGEVAAVQGTGLIGLGALNACKLRGAV
ncbi:MAG: alcohol dehydrogenase catalytic domain-containing protein, partial [Armatimonadota bacterium]|nr:alcohol dehydrogenase catalytic domain-containing protein [Armatimonadota bacterium]